MKKTKTPTLLLCLLVTILFFIIIYSPKVLESVAFSISIWKDNLFPSLFPFFVISNLLIEYGFIDILSKTIGPIMPKLFSLPKEASFVLCISLISGFPSSAKYTAKLVNENIISKEDGEQLLTFTHFSNPLFVLGFIGTILLHDQKLAAFILFCHISSNFLIGILSRKKKEKHITENLPKAKKKEYPSFGSALSKSIMDSLNTTFLLLGIITCFLVLTTIIQNLVPLKEQTKYLLSGILEMTQGIKLVGELPNFSNYLKGMWILGFISFGGLSIHMQVISFIAEEKLRYFPYLVSRILQVIISCLIYIVLFPIMV